jgi:hypothetical protein
LLIDRNHGVIFVVYRGLVTSVQDYNALPGVEEAVQIGSKSWFQGIIPYFILHNEAAMHLLAVLVLMFLREPAGRDWILMCNLFLCMPFFFEGM